MMARCNCPWHLAHANGRENEFNTHLASVLAGGPEGAHPDARSVRTVRHPVSGELGCPFCCARMAPATAKEAGDRDL